MKRFKNILVVANPISAADPVLARAMQLAAENRARVTVVSVSPDPDGYGYIREFEDALREAQESQLKSLVRKRARKGVTTQCKVLTGIPFIEIGREVVRGQHDLVMKPAEGKGGLSRRLFGSTDMHLLRKCPCPVWIKKPTTRKKYARVLAAVDTDPAIAANAELNRSILELAESIARKEGSELHIVHGWSVPHEKLMHSGRARMSPTDVKRVVRDCKRSHKAELDALLAKYDFGGLKTKVHLLKGDPADAISSVAKKSRVELVIMGTVARTGIPGFFIGNTAEKTLSRIDCSVLALKPAAFSTPVGS